MSSPAPTIIALGGSPAPQTSLTEKSVKIAGLCIVIGIGGLVTYLIYKKFFWKPTPKLYNPNADKIAQERDYSETLRSEEEETQQAIDDTHSVVDQTQEIVAQASILDMSVDTKLEITQQLSEIEAKVIISAIENKEDIIVGKMVLYNKSFDEYVGYRKHEPQWFLLQDIKDKFWKHIVTLERILIQYEKDILALLELLYKEYETLPADSDHEKLGGARTELKEYVDIKDGNPAGTQPVLGRWNEGTEVKATE